MIFNLPGRGRTRSTVPNKRTAKARRDFEGFERRIIAEMMRREREGIDTCLADVLERTGEEGVTLENVGEMMALTRERVRQLEIIGTTKAGAAGELDAWRTSAEGTEE